MSQPHSLPETHGPQGQNDTVAQAWAVLEKVMDPEVPAISVVDLGIVRDVEWKNERLHVVVTPTYSGCPATDTIEEDILTALKDAGYVEPEIERKLVPAWTTDWITDVGRERLREFGIAPPVGSSDKMSLLGGNPQVPCPLCSSTNTERVSEFGSTPCKALYRCLDCLEPFDYFKCI